MPLLILEPLLAAATHMFVPFLIENLLRLAKRLTVDWLNGLSGENSLLVFPVDLLLVYVALVNIGAFFELP